ncbi:MAG: Snf7 family protein [Candidatus Thorarchaeota archaeon]
MGPIRKALSWGRKKPDINEVTSQLRVLSKQLERQRNKLEKEERDTKARAIRARKTGNMEAYQTYAGEMIRFRRFALGVDKSRLQILKILAHVTRAQTTAQASQALNQVAKILGLLGDATDVTKVVENVDEIARRLEEFEIESGITGEAFDSTGDAQITTEDLAAAMAEIDAEAGIGESTGPVTKPISETERLEEAIKALERELGV